MLKFSVLDARGWMISTVDETAERLERVQGDDDAVGQTERAQTHVVLGAVVAGGRGRGRRRHDEQEKWHKEHFVKKFLLH